MFSVVIPLYNKAHTIQRTLSTVIAQTFGSFEVVIVDDGSTDNGVEVIQGFSSDPRIRIERQGNQGVSCARNKGVELASYPYIAFLDGDDEWLPDYLEKMSEAVLQFPNAGMFCCAGNVRNGDGTINVRLAKKYAGQIVEINFFENPHVFLHTSATIVLKTAFNETGGFPVSMKRNEDFSLFFSLALITSVVYCGFPLSTYVGGVTGQATTGEVNKDIRLLKDVINRYNNVYAAWERTNYKNQDFEVFLKYEIRHEFIARMRGHEYESMDYFLKHINPKILEHLHPFETTLFKKPALKFFGIKYIILTKLRWRLRGYPYVGQ